MRSLVILGSTGSIGTQALDVAQQAGYRVVGLAAARNITVLEKQIRQFHPSVVAVYDKQAADTLRDAVKHLSVRVLSGMDGLC